MFMQSTSIGDTICPVWEPTKGKLRLQQSRSGLSLSISTCQRPNWTGKCLSASDADITRFSLGWPLYSASMPELCIPHLKS